MLLHVLLGLGVAAVVAGLWCFMCWADAALSGWDELATRFSYSGVFKGRMYRFQKGGPTRWPGLVVGDGSPIGSLNVGMSEAGLHLVPMVPFRLFHKPLLIPWGEIKADPYKKVFFFGYRVSVRSFPDIPLFFFGGQFYDAVDHVKDLKKLG